MYEKYWRKILVFLLATAFRQTHARLSANNFEQNLDHAKRNVYDAKNFLGELEKQNSNFDTNSHVQNMENGNKSYNLIRNFEGKFL